jgi:hypothetical protein
LGEVLVPFISFSAPSLLFSAIRISCATAATIALSACIATTMQGYADRELPARPVTRIVTYVAGPSALASSIQASVQNQAERRGVTAEDALILFPPTRTYSDAEIRKGLAARAVDAVLVINVGDTGVIQQYAGTIFHAQYSGNSFAGTVNASSTPVYRYKRQTAFTARLIESATGRNLWVGNGEVNAGGLLFIGDGAAASNSVSAIFDDLQKKAIIAASS